MYDFRIANIDDFRINIKAKRKTLPILQFDSEDQ